MTDPVPAPSPQPDNTEWVIVKHSMIGSEEVVGVYPTLAEAQVAYAAMLDNPQWFTRYILEHREIPTVV